MLQALRIGAPGGRLCGAFTPIRVLRDTVCVDMIAEANWSTGTRARSGAALESSLTVWRSAAGAATCGGDWCDATQLSDDVVALTVGDVSGHGEPVAGTMTTVRAAVLRALESSALPSAALSMANRVAYTLGGGVIVTAIVARYDRRDQRLTFANAGHPPPLIVADRGHRFLHDRVGDLPLGIFADHQAADRTIDLPSDALVVLYTDGITEHQRDPIEGEKELVQAALLAHRRADVNAARAIARRVLKRSRGEDDAAVAAFRTQFA